MELAGVFAPVLFVAVFTVFGLFRGDYRAVSMYVSALSLGSWGWIQIVSFMVFGLSCGLFAVHIAGMFSSGRASKAGPIVLSLSAMCFFLSGPFVMDPMGTAQTAASPHGTIHGIGVPSYARYVLRVLQPLQKRCGLALLPGMCVGHPFRNRKPRSHSSDPTDPTMSQWLFSVNDVAA
jgi:hypothetical protein